MKDIIRYTLFLWLLTGLLLVSFSCKVKVERLDEKAEKVEDKIYKSDFDATRIIDPDWDTKIVPYFTEQAVDIKIILDSAAADPLGTTEKYAHTETAENTNYNFIVKGTGRIISVNKVSKGSVNVDLPPYDNTADIQILIGPVISSTLNSIRDAYDDLSYGDFTNQLEWGDIGNRIKGIIKETVLNELDRENLADKPVTFYGAFTLIKPDDYSKIEITPIKLEIGRSES
ncbi:MAG: DUF2291 domain-containing protein [Spirochaetales bacterium]|nr:DUF2291 domain-containing protein [Spirochaetales bacterium]